MADPDQGDVKIRTRTTVEKVDVSGAEPVHVETIVMEDGKVVEAKES